jgi:hypothetical protein
MDHHLHDYLEFFDELLLEGRALGLMRGAHSHTMLPVFLDAIDPENAGRPYTPSSYHPRIWTVAPTKCHNHDRHDRDPSPSPGLVRLPL